eukprot:TRINITY_DN11223_c0_g1_i1.p1 TRINITY_DN11223_c0_g1~~TRINITY_DN11223_c0_g1_i1.p1  ORF type:complete len:237 (+),score=80.56 TRINITY_DN11223_c0_g1_i1:55-765(+)
MSLVVYVRHPVSGGVLPCELPIDATVKDLREAAADAIGSSVSAVVYQGSDCADKDALADVGFSNECVVEVRTGMRWNWAPADDVVIDEGRISMQQHRTAVTQQTVDCVAGWELVVHKMSGSVNSQRFGLSTAGGNFAKALYWCTDTDCYWHASSRSCCNAREWKGETGEVNEGDRMGMVADPGRGKLHLFVNGVYQTTMQPNTTRPWVLALALMPGDECELMPGEHLIPNVPEDVS